MSPMRRISIIVIAVVAVVAGWIYMRSRPNTAGPAEPPQANAPSRGTAAAYVPPKEIHFTTSVAQAPYGNFNFPYPTGFAIKENDIKADSAGVKHHIVVLSWNTPPPAVGTVEINKPDRTCADYVKCHIVKGVVIGTSSKDAGFQDLWRKVVNSF